MGTLPRIVRKLPAHAAAVDQICGELRGSLLPALPTGERFVVELLLREALMNAVTHGAGGREAEEVQCEVRPVAGGIQIRVADSGRGFDWRALQRMPGPQAESGRGLHILRRYAHEVRFSGTGNQVELTRIFGKGERT